MSGTSHLSGSCSLSFMLCLLLAKIINEKKIIFMLWALGLESLSLSLSQIALEHKLFTTFQLQLKYLRNYLDPWVHFSFYTSKLLFNFSSAEFFTVLYSFTHFCNLFSFFCFLLLLFCFFLLTRSLVKFSVLY